MATKKIEVKRMIGETEVRFTMMAQSEEEVFQELSFVFSLPTTGPNGETDLVVKYRTTPAEGYKFYSVVCPSAKMEFKFGQSQKVPGTLYPKTWEPLYDASGSHQAPAPAAYVAPPVAQQAATAQQAAQQAPPVQQAPPAQQAANPADVDSVLGEFGL